MLGDDHGCDAFTEIRMWQADHGGLYDAGQCIDFNFNFFRINVNTTANNQILATTNDDQITSIVDFAEISGDEETIFAKFLCGFLRSTPITLKHVRAPDFEHANLAVG